MTFVQDFRTSNPKLHKLYVGWAYETLQLTKLFCDELLSHSRVHSHLIAGAAWQQAQQFIQEQAHYWDAAAMLFSGIELSSEYRTDEELISSLPDDVLASLPPINPRLVEALINLIKSSSVAATAAPIIGAELDEKFSGFDYLEFLAACGVAPSTPDPLSWSEDQVDAAIMAHYMATFKDKISIPFQDLRAIPGWLDTQREVMRQALTAAYR